MKFEPYRLFLMISPLFLLAQFWISGNWPVAAFFYTALAAWAWYQIPRSFEGQPSTLGDAFPIMMLILFMMVLCAAPRRSTSEALFFTASGLIAFRSLIFILKHMRVSRKAIPKVIQGLMAGLLIEILVNGVQVYSTFRLVSPDALKVAGFLQFRGLMLFLLIGWMIDREFTAREKKFGGVFALGLMGAPVVAGTMLIMNLSLMIMSPRSKV